MGETVTNILGTIRKQADSSGSSTTGFYKDAEILKLMQLEWGELYDLLIKKYENLFVEVTSGATLITLVSGTDSYTLPSTTPPIKKIIGVDLKETEPDYISLGNLPWSERNSDPLLVYETMVGQPTGYVLIGIKILFRPIPMTPGTVRIWYIPQAATLVESAPTAGQISSMPDVVEPGWESTIIDGVCGRLWLAQQDVEMANMFLQKKEMKKIEIAEALKSRDAGRPKEVELIRRRRRL